MLRHIRDWLAADTLNGRHIARGNVWEDPMNNSDKICAVILLLCMVGCFVVCFLSIWFDWNTG